MFNCLKEVRTGDIFDYFPEMDNLQDPYAQGDKRGKCRWTSSDGLCRTHLQHTLTAYFWNFFTLSRNIGGNLVPWMYKPPFRFTAIVITGNITSSPFVAVHGVQLRQYNKFVFGNGSFVF